MMSEPIRVLHFADVHIGMENYGRIDPETGLSGRVVDFVRRLDDMVDYAREQNADLVIFAGDAFKTRNPEPTFQREFAHRVRDLAEIAPVVLLAGNHDLAPHAIKASSIEIYETLAVPNVWVAHEFEVKTVQTKRGPVIVGTAPYPMRARIMDKISPAQGSTMKQLDTLIEEQFTKLLLALAEDADALDESGQTPRLLTGHFTVKGAVTGSERQVMLGQDVSVSLNVLADDRWDYVALGHIHKYQNLTAAREGLPPVVYCGSLERIDFGEEGDPKGFCWVSLVRDASTYAHIPVAARPMVTLRYECQDMARPTEHVVRDIGKHDLKDAIVRVAIRLSQENENQLVDASIREALRHAGVFHIAGIRHEVDRPERSRLAMNPEGLTSEQLLEQYLISRSTDATRRNILLEAARDLMRDDPNQ